MKPTLASLGFDPLRSDCPFIVYLDLKSPYAYLAKDPTRELANSLGVRVDWRPLSLDIPSFAGSAKLDASDGVAESQRSAAQWTWVKYAYMDARRYARLRGLQLRGTIKIWDTTLAGIAMLWAKEQGEQVLARFLDLSFESFWKRELDAESPQAIEQVLRESGAEVAGFLDAAEAARPDYLAWQTAIFDAGIFGVPGYVVDGEYHWGREHLPRVRWILEGRKGPAPDIAYPCPDASAGAFPVKNGAVRVAVDFHCASSWLAVAPTRALEARLAARFDWLPLPAVEWTRAKVVVANGDRSARHYRLRSDYIAGELRRYAASCGSELGETRRSGDTTAASLGLLWLRERDPAGAGAYVERVFERIWRENAEPDLDFIEGHLGAAAPGFRAWAESEGLRALQGVREQLETEGVWNVPAYLAGGELFIGRQHLPLVEQLATARQDVLA